VLLVQSQSIAQTVAEQLNSAAPVTIEDQPVTGQKSMAASPLQYFAPAMAIFFVLFTGTNGALAIFESKEDGTLPRLLVTPTSRVTILAGKFLGMYLTGLFQLLVLIAAMPLVGLVVGSTSSVWGSNIPGVVLVALSAAAASSGLGILVVGLARDKNQANVLVSIIPIFMGAVGGAFFDLSGLGGAFPILAKLTINYWATNGFSQLAATNDLMTVLPNIGVLLGMFILFFVIGLRGFVHHLDADTASAPRRAVAAQPVPEGIPNHA